MTINNISDIIGSLLTSQLNKTNLDILSSMTRLSTGKKINSASDDAAGLAIASRLEAQARGLSAAQQNAQLGVSMIQTAEGSLESVTSDIQRIRELSVQAANGSLNSSDREAIQAEISQVGENIDFTFGNAQFNSNNLFSGTTESFQVGADSGSVVIASFPEISSASLGVSAIDVTSQSGAESAISAADYALDQILSVRTDLGATQNRLESSMNTLAQTELDTLGALSRIMDANMAEEAMNLAASTTRLNAQLAVAAQVNKLQGGLINLLLED